MDDRNFHQRFIDSLKQRDWQLGALIAVPLAGFLLAETVSALLPEGTIEERCARAVRTQIAERLLIGAMAFDVGRAEVTPAEDGSLTVEIDIEANGIPIRAGYRCAPETQAGAQADLSVRRLWTRRV